MLRLVALGWTNRQIAQELIVTGSTVKAHVQHLLAKLGVPDRTAAAVRAVQLGLLSFSTVPTVAAPGASARPSASPALGGRFGDHHSKAERLVCRAAPRPEACSETCWEQGSDCREQVG